MAEICRSCVAKDQLIYAQGQIIEELKSAIHRISGQVPQIFTQLPGASCSTELAQIPDTSSLELPTVTFEELSAFNDVHPVQFVPATSMTVTAAPAVSAANGVESPQEETETIIRKRTVQPRGMPGIRRGRGPKQTGVPRRKRRAAQMDGEVDEYAPRDNSHGGFEDDSAAHHAGFTPGGSPEPGPHLQYESILRPQAGAGKISHILVLGSPHTRKIPLRCPLPNCPHSEYRAWDRDLLRKHFEKYHADTHPNPIFNYLCPFEGCRYISYNEPSYALYTHVKNVHREYLAQCEQNVAEGNPIVERDLGDVYVETLPSEIKRTAVPILGTISMEKAGLKCPLSVCQAGTAIFKYSSMKKLVEHFEKLHSFTHPHPIFVYYCPVEGCNYNSDVGNFRIYKHLKADHAEYLTVPPPGTSYTAAEPEAISDEAVADIIENVADKEETVPSGNQADLPHYSHAATENVSVEDPPAAPDGTAVSSDQIIPGAVENEGGKPQTAIVMKGSPNMILDPLKCPLENCPREDFIATSTILLRRHFWRVHRSTHPDPVFYFTCPVEQCTFIGTKEQNMNIWRHIKKLHPEKLAPEPRQIPSNVLEDALAISGISGEPGGTTAAVSAAPPPPDSLKPEEQIRVAGVQDVLHPGTLVRPFQLRCLYPGCEKPPFSGADKTQLLRHYAHYHRSVDRKQGIVVVCPFKDCDFQCTWPAQPLHFHVESVHAHVPEVHGMSHPLNVSTAKEVAVQSTDDHTPVRIVGRPYTSGSFWCPVPGCGFSNSVLLQMRNHVIESHQTTHPNPTFIYVCPMQGCSFAKQSNYQALCTHMQREHGMKRDRNSIAATSKRSLDPDEADSTQRSAKKRASGSKRRKFNSERTKKIKKSTTKAPSVDSGSDESLPPSPGASDEDGRASEHHDSQKKRRIRIAVKTGGTPAEPVESSGLPQTEPVAQPDEGETALSTASKKSSAEDVRRGAPRKAKAKLSS